jgi:hypothetical protein
MGHILISPSEKTERLNHPACPEQREGGQGMDTNQGRGNCPQIMDGIRSATHKRIPPTVCQMERRMEQLLVGMVEEAGDEEGFVAGLGGRVALDKGNVICVVLSARWNSRHYPRQSHVAQIVCDGS